jgi:CBS domain-containing protein
MTTEVRSCAPDTNAAAAAALMLDGDCGILPVVEGGTIVGIVTDRDLYIALATRNVLPSQLAVGEVMRTRVWTCAPQDEVHAALATMKARRVRRLPVRGADGRLVGIVSMNDLLLAAGDRQAFSSDEIVDTFQAICAHERLLPRAAA